MSDDENSRKDAATVTSSPAVIAASWALVGVPLAYGLYETVLRAANLFGG